MKLLFTIFLSSISISCFSQAGFLDESFGASGRVYTDVRDQCFAAALQRDGKILVGGFLLARYFTDGSLDSSFGKSGIMQTNLSNIQDIQVLPNGRVIISGSAYLKVAAAKFQFDGILD